MCVSAWPAEFTNTITGTWEVLVDGLPRHVICYQNRVGSSKKLPSLGQMELDLMVMHALKNPNWEEVCASPMKAYGITKEEILTEADWREKGGARRDLNMLRLAMQSSDNNTAHGNCLLIPILGSWESIRLLNTAETKNILTDIHEAVKLPVLEEEFLSLSVSTAGTYGGSKLAFIKFDIYDIVLAEDANSIPEAVKQIQADKRPQINDAVFTKLKECYDAPLAVCCFRQTDIAEACPIAFSFQPRDPAHLVVYTLDGHDGNPPDAESSVLLDHTIFVGSYLTPPEHAAKVSYSDKIPPHLRPYVLDFVMGMPLSGWMKNGDFVFELSKVQDGIFEAKRKMPSGGLYESQSRQDIRRDPAYKSGTKSKSK